MLGIPSSTLRYWESEFPDLKPARTPHNQRFYRAKEMEYLEMIKFLLYEKGMKVEAAREYLSKNKKNVSQKLELVAQLEEIKNELESLLEALSLRQQKI